MIHGAGIRDVRWPAFWGRIPRILRAHGAQVFFGNQDSWGSIETNAEMIAARIREILRETGAEKVNIIAHSKGGLDVRRAAAMECCAGKIASITTMGTPHRGMKTVDRLFRLPGFVWDTVTFFMDGIAKLAGDRKPDFRQACAGFTTQRMARFNAQYPDRPEICYRSYAALMRGPASDLSFSASHALVRRIEGPNDGLITVESALRGADAHVLCGTTGKGISHMDLTDLRKTRIPCRDGDKDTDICAVYVEIVEDLKKRGL